VRRLGLGRALDDPLCAAVLEAGWEPVPLFVTAMEATLAAPPEAHPDAVILLSPAAARMALLPPRVPCLAQGEATARAVASARALRAQVAGRTVLVSDQPQAEGLFELLRERFPQGGTFLLARGERSRRHLEQAAAGTPWRLLPWITHRERPVDPPPALPPLDAVLALSPLQAELLAPRSGQLLRFAWGQRTARAFEKAGYPGDGWCEPEASALRLLLSSLPLP
jgi:uroporphyrinogen-III synthase